MSLLPLITEATDYIGLTHLILAAFHLNHNPADITLNDDPPDAPKNISLWDEVPILQDIGIKVLAMLGGAAKGSFTRLDRSDADFEAYYTPFRDILLRYNLDGVDLDVEEEMSLAGIVRLIDRLKADFGASFLITLAPVATALQGARHLSGFDYEALEVMRGPKIAFYNTQFYNSWGSLLDTRGYDNMIARGWPAEKVVVGVLTHPGNGHGFLPMEDLQRTLGFLVRLYPRLGGVMGWEYGGPELERPWEWAESIMRVMRT